MKNLSMYLSEARTLKDLKGKTVNKIEFVGDNLKWADNEHTVFIKNFESVNDEDIKEMYEHMHVYNCLYIKFDIKGKHVDIDIYVVSNSKVSVAVYIDDKDDADHYIPDFKDNLKEFNSVIKDIQKIFI